MAETLDFLLLVLQTTFYILTAILGLIISVSVGITSEQFGNRCLLYAKVYHYPKQTNCSYVLVITVVFGVIYGALAGALHVYQLRRMRRGQEPILASLLPLIFAGISAVTCLLYLIVACMLTVGLNVWCGSLLDEYPYVPHCKDFQEAVWEDDVNGSAFYTNLKMAEICGWLSWLVMVALIVISVVSLLRKGTLQRFIPGLPAGGSSSKSNDEPSREMEYPVTGITPDARY